MVKCIKVNVQEEFPLEIKKIPFIFMEFSDQQGDPTVKRTRRG